MDGPDRWSRTTRPSDMAALHTRHTQVGSAVFRESHPAAEPAAFQRKAGLIEVRCSNIAPFPGEPNARAPTIGSDLAAENQLSLYHNIP